MKRLPEQLDMKSIPLFGTEENVPAKVGALQHNRTETFDDPDLGVALRYLSPDGTTGDVFIYNLGIKGIPDEVRSPEVEEFFQRECAQMKLLAENGTYRDFQFLLADIMPFPDNQSQAMYHVAGFRYRREGSAHTLFDSHLALRTERGFIIKVRYTYPHCTGQEEVEKIGLYGLFLFELYDSIRFSFPPRFPKEYQQ